MRKHLGPTILILLGFCALALAQTINSSVQMSQDPRGPLAMDTNQGFYFPQHILNTGPKPTVTGTGTPTVAGSDAMGVITMGTSATTATLLFAKAYNTVPACVAAAQQTGQASPISFVPATTSIAITQNSASGNLISYLCMSTS